MQFSDLAPNHLHNLVTVERTSSILSLGGILWILLSFLFFHYFQSPINRMMFLATLGNIFTFVATFVARSALSNPDGSLCQFQAFLIQVFLEADALFSCAMAINLLLTFQYRHRPEDLRRLEKYYAFVCYGLPTVIGLVFLGVHTAEKGRFYGDAGLWCWVSTKWEIFRIITFYAPVWLIQLVSIVIFSWVGRIIFRRGQQMKKVQREGALQQRIRVDRQVTVTGYHNIDLQRPQPIAGGGFLQVFGTANSVDISASGSSRSKKFGWPSLRTSGNNPATSSSSKRTALRNRERNQASVMWQYFRVALLFFVVQQLVWAPSSANRVYSYTHREEHEINLPLTYISAIVLPLQGYMNAVIYTYTSWDACKLVWKDFQRGRLWPRHGLRKAAAVAFLGNDDDAEDGENGVELLHMPAPSTTNIGEVVEASEMV